MKHIIICIMTCMLACCYANAQTVTKVSHSKAVKTDVVTTGEMTIRKPDYICISTDGGKDQLIMDGTKFTMTMKGKKHTTDSKTNALFATFQKVLHAVINHQPIPTGNDLTIQKSDGLQTITITPSAQKRQLFTSFVLIIDSKTSVMKQLRMNGRSESYTEYTFK
ncbi:MAG: outer membrane lipoprotein carrier protein LolA [Prevotella sp.]|nr:outer membrane lipoprotein carrier protein LolA [Prevotella sp.]